MLIEEEFNMKHTVYQGDYVFLEFKRNFTNENYSKEYNGWYQLIRTNGEMAYVSIDNPERLVKKSHVSNNNGHGYAFFIVKVIDARTALLVAKFDFQDSAIAEARRQLAMAPLMKEKMELVAKLVNLPIEKTSAMNQVEMDFTMQENSIRSKLEGVEKALSLGDCSKLDSIYVYIEASHNSDGHSKNFTWRVPDKFRESFLNGSAGVGTVVEVECRDRRELVEVKNVITSFDLIPHKQVLRLVR